MLSHSLQDNITVKCVPLRNIESEGECIGLMTIKNTREGSGIVFSSTVCLKTAAVLERYQLILFTAEQCNIDFVEKV